MNNGLREEDNPIRSEGSTMRFARSVAMTLGTRGLALPIGIASSVLTARLLGPEGRGIIVLLTVLQGLAIQFGSVGFNASMTYFISRDRSLSEAVGSNAFVVATVAGVLTAFLFLGAEQIFPGVLLGSVDLFYLLIFVFALPFCFYTQFFQNMFLAHQRIVEFNILDLTSRVLQLVGFFLVLFVLGFSTVEAVISMTAATILTGVISIWRTNLLSPVRLRFDRPLFREMFLYGIRSYAASFLMFLVFRVNIFLINLLLGEAEAGVFSVAMQITDVLYLIPVTLGLILFPKVSADQQDKGELSAKVFRFSLVVMTLACLVLALFGEVFIIILFGESFRGAVEPLYWFLPGMVALSLVTVLNNDLSARGLPPIVIVAPACGLALSIIINLILLPVIGISAGSIGSSAAFFLILILLTIHFRRRLALRWRDLFVPTLQDLRPSP